MTIAPIGRVVSGPDADGGAIIREDALVPWRSSAAAGKAGHFPRGGTRATPASIDAAVSKVVP